jgi:general secretion pathway protein M
MGFAAIVLAVIAWGLATELSYRDLRTVYDVKSETLKGLKTPGATDLGANKSAGRDAYPTTVAASSETVAASILQRYLLDQLESAGGIVQSVQAEPRRETMSPGLPRLSAQLVFDVSITALQRLLFGLETGLPFVFVDSLAVQPAVAMPGDARVGDKLHVTLIVTSYWKAGSPDGVDR